MLISIIDFFIIIKPPQYVFRRKDKGIFKNLMHLSATMVRWFCAKKYGWGWTPCSVEGWLITIFWTLGILIFAFSRKFPDNTSFSKVFLEFMLPVFLWVAVLIVIAYQTGDKPRWRWGK
jgi:hypothetical protein